MPPEGSVPFRMNDLRIKGNKSRLGDCSVTPWRFTGEEPGTTRSGASLKQHGVALDAVGNCGG